MKDIMPGITYPANGRRVYKENLDYEQESKSASVSQRLSDFLTFGVQHGGEVSVSGDSILIGVTLAYDTAGRRVEVRDPVLFRPPIGSHVISLRHVYATTGGNVPDMHGTVVEHRSDSYDIVARTPIDGDIPLVEVKSVGGVVTIAKDLRVFRNIKISGDAVVNGSLTVKGNLTEIETKNQTIKDNVITLNRGETGAGVTSQVSGFEIDRGSSPKVSFVFDEAIKRFKAGFEGDESPIIRDKDLTYIRVHTSTGNHPIYIKRDPEGGNYLYWSDSLNGNFRPFA